MKILFISSGEKRLIPLWLSDSLQYSMKYLKREKLEKRVSLFRLFSLWLKIWAIAKVSIAMIETRVLVAMYLGFRQLHARGVGCGLKALLMRGCFWREWKHFTKVGVRRCAHTGSIPRSMYVVAFETACVRDFTPHCRAGPRATFIYSERTRPIIVCALSTSSIVAPRSCLEPTISRWWISWPYAL